MINVIFAFLIGAIIVGMGWIIHWVTKELDGFSDRYENDVNSIYRAMHNNMNEHMDHWHRYPANYYNVKPPYDRPYGSDIFKVEKVPPIEKEPEQEVKEDPEENKEYKDTVDDIEGIFD